MLSINKFAQNLTGIAELEQSLSLFFRTPKGSIPLHPELGFGIVEFVDRNVTAVLQLIQEANEGLQLWDDRIIATSILPTYSVGALTILVVWHPASDPNNIINTPVPLQN